MRPIDNISSIARAEDGATLVETLVAIVMGVLVIGALCGILVISLHQSKRTTDRVDADQRGRIAMTRIVNELHSACLSQGFTPIQSGSKESELRFQNAYSKEAVIPRSEVREHRIQYSGETLRDYQYPATGGSWPTFTFAGSVATPSGGTLLASHVTKTESKPIFSYYKYATTSSAGSATESTTTLTSLGTAELTTTTAPTAASVLINFTVAPSNGSEQRGRTVPFSTQVTLAFSSPAVETPIQAAPCE